ncbi:hypothetical protein [Nocardia sp. NPDC003963]
MTRFHRTLIERLRGAKLPQDWTLEQREEHFAALEPLIASQVARETDLDYHARLARFGTDHGRPPNDAEKNGMRDSARDTAYEIAILELDDYYDEEEDLQEEPVEELADLALELWDDHDTATQKAGAQLLLTRYRANLPIPASNDHPLFEQIHQTLLREMSAEERRSDPLHSSST